MALRVITKIGDEILRSVARPVTMFDSKLGIIIDDMKETMIHENGVGLAAPQIGLMKRICVVSIDHENFYELVNPKIIKQSGHVLDAEGCLSVPNRNGEVTRPRKITVEAFDRHGNKNIFKVSDFCARAFCHEIDHLDGILFIDKLEEEKVSKK